MKITIQIDDQSSEFEKTLLQLVSAHAEFNRLKNSQPSDVRTRTIIFHAQNKLRDSLNLAIANTIAANHALEGKKIPVNDL